MALNQGKRNYGGMKEWIKRKWFAKKIYSNSEFQVTEFHHTYLFLIIVLFFYAQYLLPHPSVLGCDICKILLFPKQFRTLIYSKHEVVFHRQFDSQLILLNIAKQAGHCIFIYLQNYYKKRDSPFASEEVAFLQVYFPIMKNLAFAMLQVIWK